MAKINQWIIIVSSIAGFLLMALVILLLLQKRKNLILKKEQAEKEKMLREAELRELQSETLLKERELESLQFEKLLKENEVEKLNIQVQLKEQDLVYQTLLRTDLTQVNRSVKEKLIPFKIRLSGKKDQIEFEQVLLEITRDADKDPLSDFEIMFTRLHKSFNEQLMAKCPSLTKSELQICSLLRINLSTKDIARLLNLSVSSIDNTRYRIRQKLELDKNDNLNAYLIGF